MTDFCLLNIHHVKATLAPLITTGAYRFMASKQGLWNKFYVQKQNVLDRCIAKPFQNGWKMSPTNAMDRR